MKVFICWSGSQSKKIAEALKQFLPRMINAVQPFLSLDIGAGERWFSEVASELEQTRFGILCMTPDSLESRWIHFEAGAISKEAGRSNVVPYLRSVTTNDLTLPLSVFQSVPADGEGTLKLVLDLAAVVRANGEVCLSDEELKDTFGHFWPDLEEKLQEADAAAQARPPQRSLENMVEEVLSYVRALARAEQKRQRPSSAAPTMAVGARRYMEGSGELRYAPVFLVPDPVQSEIDRQLSGRADEVRPIGPRQETEGQD